MHFRNLPKFNVLLGDRILEANRSMRVDESAEIGLDFGEIYAETAKKIGIQWPDDLKRYHRVTDGGTELVRVPIRYLKLRRDTVLWAAPLELFCEVAIRVRNRSPFANTFYYGYTNGWLGYMTTEEAMKEGGYEESVSPYTGAAERDFGDAAIMLLQGMGN